MTDPLTITGAGLAILGSKDIINKILGPTAEYIGDEFKNLVGRCNINLDEIFKKAHKKLGPRIDSNEAVNPRVLKHVLDEGRFVEDELVAEYFGGILASSRTYNGKDDRSVYHINIIKSLSSYQIKLHYLVYSKLLVEINDNFIDLRKAESRNNIKVYIPERLLHYKFECHKDDIFLFSTHSMSGLCEKTLLSTSIFSNHYKDKNFNEPGIIASPTVLGIELFFLANGYNKFAINQIANTPITESLLYPTISIEDINKMMVFR